MIKQINNPTNGQLSILLAPGVIACLISILTRDIATWALWTMIVSLAAYFISLTYFCIRQKCYKFLFVTLAKGVIAIGTLYLIWII